MRTYCDFMVWTNEDIKFERIYSDEDFWLDCVGRVNMLFTSSILPELMGKWFSRPSTPTSAAMVIATAGGPTLETWWDVTMPNAHTSGFISLV